MSPLACTLAGLALLGAAIPATLAACQDPQPGYTDTPLLPDGWRVHDKNRPRPAAVDPGPAPMLPTPAPSDAIVLFDGSTLDAFHSGGGPAKWNLVDGAMEGNRTGDLFTKAEFGDCQLHIEWRAPSPVKGDSQGRGNSGVFFFGRYEVQVLDSYQNPTYADGQASALYGQQPPLVNACRPPGEWQAYDIVFVAPRFADGKLVSPARVTVFHNGVLTQHDEALLGTTEHRALGSYEPHGDRGPIKLQDHGDPVRFRNLWVRPLQLQRPAAK
ncbi:MAG: DUF1080 domain-containing protein [Planctomycetes bacterium]|nr:DUF1080 domain-containing protein [Planctomycetota bacterium]MCC7398156.1 DUF1080 domain-containing protein [Planctomycetota bacterium]